MPQNDYQFLDAYSSVLTAHASLVTANALEPYVQISSFLTALPVAPTGNQSVSGQVAASLVGQLPAGTGLLGSVVALQGTDPWLIRGSVQAAVSGSIATIQSGTVISSIVNTVPSSVLVGASIFGQLPAGTAPLGSIAVLQGTNPWINTNVGSIITVNQGSSILSVPVGSTIVVLQSSSILAVPVGSTLAIWQSPSIVGTYAEDAGHTTADKGLFALGVRNDAVASFVSADLDYTPHAMDSAGRTIMKPFSAEESRVEGYGSTVSTSQMTLVAAAGAGLRNYITDLWFANTGGSATLVTFKDGAGSILGYTIAPAGSGSNLPGLQVPIRTGANATFDVQPGTGVSILYATVKGFKAP